MKAGIIHALRYGQAAHDVVNGRDDQGRLTHTCSLCGWTRVVLSAPTVRGPAHEQRPDLGARMTKATRANVYVIRDRQLGEKRT